MLKIYRLFLIIFISIGVINTAYATRAVEKSCFKESLKELSKIPKPEAQESLVIISEKILISADINDVYRKFNEFPLSQLLTETGDIAGVTTTYSLIGKNYINKGDKRAVCLTDGYGAIEELLMNNTPHRFAYRVWNFTLPDANSISYANGEFLFKSVKNGTEVTWNYSFALKTNKFPGNIGSIGRWLFRKSFAESDWKPYMHQALMNFNKYVRLGM